MEGTLGAIMARPMALAVGLMVVGALLAFVEFGTAASIAFMLAGLAIMVASVRGGSGQAAGRDETLSAG